MAERIGIEEARKNLGPLVHRVQHGGAEIILTRNGKPAARIVPIPQETTMASTAEIASNFPGRDIHTYDLLEEMREKYDLDRRTTHESIHAFLSQVIEIDGEDAVVLSSRPIRPDLLDSNPRDLDVHYWLTISGSAAEAIREAFAATYATEED